MAVTQEIRQALNLKRLKLPPEPRVLNIEVQEFVDHTGDDALRIWLTIDEDTDVEKLSGRAILDLKMAIHDSLLARGVDLFPYISLVKPSELEDD